jgi:hypothetical protein
MAWTTPKTWASGYVVLAADLNTHLRDNLNVTAPAVMTTAGDIIYASGANTPARLAKSTTSTQYLANTGTSNVPAWNEVALATGVSGVLPVANGGVGVALSAPGADRILFWDHTATAYAYLTAGSGLTISGTTMTSAGIAAVVDDTTPQVGGSAGFDLQAQLLVGNGGSTGIAISANGEVTMAAQPTILYRNAVADANVTGDGTAYTLTGFSEILDYNSDFDGQTFTAPVTGAYFVSTWTNIAGLTSGMTDGRLYISSGNGQYGNNEMNIGAIRGANNQAQFQVSALVDMDECDTFTVILDIAGGAKVADLNGGTGTSRNSFISATLLH